MRVLITGVPGWLGNRFLDILGEAKKDWSVRCLVLPAFEETFSKTFSNRKNIENVSGDITKIETLASAFVGVDIVFHIAGIIHPKKTSELYTVNTVGTENVLKKSAEAGVRRVVFISSNSVSGTRPAGAPLMKEDDPPRPYLQYGKSKYLAEEKVREYQRLGRLETVILRPCWYYGPNQPDRQSTFFQMIKKGNPLIFGDGSNLRSMSYVDNTCQAMILAAESPKASGQIYWIADAKPYTSNEIYSTIAKLLDVKDYRPRHLPGIVSEGCLLADELLQSMGLYVKEIHVAGEMNKNIACSIEKARRELGYDPKIALEEGMRRSIEWCRKRGADF